MEFTIAKSAGFCFGVKRAIDSAYKYLEENQGKVYSIGPLIHNEIVTNDLKAKGLIELNDIDVIKNLKNENIIIRTHGIEKDTFEILKRNGNNIIDLTCPFVSKIHKLVDEYSKNAYKVIVIGDKEHPEVKGIVSYAKNGIDVVINESDVNKLKIDRNDKVFIVFQTTTNALNAEKLVDILTKLFYNYKLVNTICNATQNRQDETARLSKECDVMLIIGSRTSSNTRKLFEIASLYCKKTYLLSDKSDTKNINIEKNSKVGVSAGASTPVYLVEEILKNVRDKF